MADKKSAWAKGLRVLALLIALAIVVYWFWYVPLQQPLPRLQIEFTP
jgi:hypothetical protein